ncbi:MAG: hypothetical protein B7Y41_06240 [Hydrogenophilales bacterium 28-61-23]|nr:MAG: hypothetical protein B7Y41_06240 [Hydrogenophilales bacterium 28-61-23]
MISIKTYRATSVTHDLGGNEQESKPFIFQYVVRDTDLDLTLGVFTIDDDGTAEEIKAKAEACKAKYEAEPWSSPFVKYREILLAGHGGAMRLGRLALSLYNGRVFPMDAGDLGGLDKHYLEIAIELIRSYHQFGENDRDFLAVCDDIKKSWEVGQYAESEALSEAD